MANRVQQVGLAQARTAVDEQRVVHDAGLLCHGEGACMSKAVGLADHEGIEGVIRVQSSRAIPRRSVFRVFVLGRNRRGRGRGGSLTVRSVESGSFCLEGL